MCPNLTNSRCLPVAGFLGADQGDDHIPYIVIGFVLHKFGADFYGILVLNVLESIIRGIESMSRARKSWWRLWRNSCHQNWLAVIGVVEPVMLPVLQSSWRFVPGG